MIRVAVLIAPGFEEIEAITPIDTLRRAGVVVMTLGVGSEFVTGAHNIQLECHFNVDDFPSDLDAVIIPGGMPGALNISKSHSAMKLINRLYNEGKLIAAICASPGVVLGRTDILEGRKFTCYPGFENKVIGGHFSEDRVVIDGNVITSKGPGTALEFSLAIVRALVSEDKCLELKKSMIVEY